MTALAIERPVDFLRPTLGDTHEVVQPNDETSEEVAAIDLDAYRRARKRTRQRNEATRERIVDVKLATAWMEGLSFVDIADVLGIKPSVLEGWLHETTSIPARKEPRISLVLEVLRTLHRVLSRDATGRWFNLEIPDLSGTPLEAFKRNAGNRVLSVVRSYLDPSYT